MTSFVSVHVSAPNKTVVLWSGVSLSIRWLCGPFVSLQAREFAILRSISDLLTAVLNQRESGKRGLPCPRWKKS